MSSKRRLRRKQCETKIKHESRSNAFSALRSLLKRDNKWFMTVYKCKFCGKWHIGHSKGQGHFHDNF